MAKRRPSGDGMVRKRDDGRWEGRIVVGHKENGDSIFRYVYADTQKELTAKLRKHITAYQGADLSEQSGMALGEWLDVFMDAIRKDELWYDFFYTELMTGLRRGELCGLMWDDFNEEDGTLSIRRTVRREKGNGLITGDTKTYAGSRKILLPHSTAQLLRERRKTALTEWIFPDPIRPEQPTDPGAAYNRLKYLLKQAGLPGLRFHDLRHTFATHALANGVDIKTLSGILGHTRAAFTLDTYTHTTGDMQKRAAEIVGDFMTDIFGEDLKPWEENAKTARAPSA